MEHIRRDLDELMAAVQNINGAIQFMSQRVAWSETCFKKVQDSGVIHMMEAVRKVMEDHKKIQSQISMLSMRIAAMQGQNGGGGQEDSSLPMVKRSTNKYGS